jgi:DNA-binding transcriptional LysR family regulator
MELRHLRYFVTVADELHFARAAARLNISAPTLSHQIRALEHILDAKLFTRRTKSAVALTHPGARFLVEARETLRAAEIAELTARRAARGELGTLAIGYMTSASMSGLVQGAIKAFRANHPDVTFELRRMETYGQLKALGEGTLDIAFTRALHRYPTGLTGFIVDRHLLWLALPAEHRLANRKQISPAMLADEPFVAPSLEMEVGFWSNIAAVTPPGGTLRIAARAGDAFTVLTMVAAGLGVSVLPRSLSRANIPGVVFRPISGGGRQVGDAVVHRKLENAPVVRAFIDSLRRRTHAS